MRRPEVAPRDRLIVALDVPSVAEAEALVERLGETIGFYKIGLELAFVGGIALAERLVGEGRKVFLDLKLHDIPATVERATAQVARLGATFLTVHAMPQTMAAAQKAVKESAVAAGEGGVGGKGLGILGVTVMTSYDDRDLKAAGYSVGVRELVGKRADQAVAAGVAGLILSAEEVADMRRRTGHRLVLVTPGIRPAGAEIGDQKRVMTPAAALAAGADHLVVGRPITRADDPRAAAEAVLAEMGGGSL